MGSRRPRLHGIATSDENIAALEKKSRLQAAELAKRAERAEARGKRKAAKRAAGEALWAEVTCGGKGLGNLNKADLDCLVEYKNPRLPKKGKRNKPELKLALRDQFGTEITTVAAVGAGPPATSESNDDTADAAHSFADPGSDDEENSGPVAMGLDE